jgi:cytochrome c peroxidase
MKKSIPILILAAALATATFFSCKKEKDLDNFSVQPGTESLEMPSAPYQYFDNGFNGITDQDLKAALGRALFYDRHLSINNSVSCASCHKQAFAFADNVALSRGFENRLTSRNSMPIENLPGQFTFFGGGVNLFWDGRSASLNDLIVRPISNHVEMGISDINSLPAKLQELPYYKDLFKQAYQGDETITLERISESVSFFLQSITANNSKFDKQQRGEKVMNGQELYGMTLFDTKYNCRSCHSLSQSIYMGGGTGSFETPNFVDIGLEPTATDKGRGVISGNSADNGKFRIPNLHNIALTAPYMHDGRFRTLEQVIDHYSHNINNSSNLDDRLKGPGGNPIQMNIGDQEKAALIAFLNTLTDAEMIIDPRFSNPFKIK